MYTKLMYIMDSEIKFSISTKFSSAKATLDFNLKKKKTRFYPVSYDTNFPLLKSALQNPYNLKLQMGSMITAQNIPIILIPWSKSRAKSQ